MKKIAISTMMALFCFSLAFGEIVNDIPEPYSGRIPIENYNKANIVPANKCLSRENTPVPDYEFIKYPTTIMTSYYDYMMGSYESFPLRMQTEHGDGYYLTFFARPTTTDNRRQYWAYLDSTFDLVDWGTISTNDIGQGYGGIDIHPATGDCIASWHEQDIVLGYGTTISYDDYDLIEMPGFWSIYLFIPPEEPEVNEYIWPYIYVGPSPMGDGYVRVYQLAKNYTHDPFDNPCEDLRINYMDIENYNGASLLDLLVLENWNTVTVMTDWRDYSCRPLSQPFAIDFNTPGKVAIIGYNAWLEGDLGSMPCEEGVFVWESYDYGETWDYANLHTDGPTDYIYIVDNIPGFTDDPGNILDSIEVDVAGWHNTALYDSDGNLHWTYMQQYGFTDSTGTGYYFKHFLPPAEAVWDGTYFTFHEVPELPGIDPLSGHSVPWEIVGDDTLLYTTIGFSKYPGTSNIFHESAMKNAINVENGWILQMWADGTYVQLAEDGDPGYQEYAEHPIIFISVSSDNGETWSEPIELTDIYSTLFDFSGQITAYPYVCNKIIDLGDDWGQVLMYYFDDNSFGAYAGTEPHGENNGGQINFCTIKIKFPEQAVDPEHTNITNLSLTNYPNPFSNSTYISFSAKKSIRNSIVEIYNIKGQLIRTLKTSSASSNEGYAIWDGKDSYNNDVANGIYLYRLKTNNSVVTKKMLLAR
ncbi:hypothetical protein DRP43_06240 [candidate division TA06 bacterium]|uniref:Secretion system C-terminal sorting domain-containing protein n=1 Tax=candidate division TA06 bacterium TaxID=2250710 RepID=A0A660SAL4_UNCT6|nr:MAG: hypothetical protein DRP43_06240 [candidate division TA06 bacterium]